MKTFRFNSPVYWSAVCTVVASVTACGGGATDSKSQPLAASGARMQKLVVVGPGDAPPACVVSVPALGNIDFGQIGWAAADNSPGEPVPVGAMVPVSLSFTDLGAGDIHTVRWGWGDGSTDTGGAVTEVPGAGMAINTHTYVEPGVYAVTAVVADACASATATRQLVVYDPSAGFVTGGGWIVSPGGAYAADPTLTGRANFGFVSKYIKGTTVPKGETEFQFQTARLNFHSTSYEWLVVAGARAQYKGVGSVNGVDGFKFMLTAIDGNLLGGGKGLDRFRIKIWHFDADQNADVVDYDNQIDASLAGSNSEGTAIGGGSIVIHK